VKIWLKSRCLLPVHQSSNVHVFQSFRFFYIDLIVICIHLYSTRLPYNIMAVVSASLAYIRRPYCSKNVQDKYVYI